MTDSASHPYILILAGGSGERFWPLSRSTKPKHLLCLLSGKTLLEETLERLEPMAPADHIFILTNQVQAPIIRELLPNVPEANIIAEPAKRDTAPAVALGVGLIARKDHQATMVMLPADHIIQNRETFLDDLRLAVAAARENHAIVTLGIPPTWACPGFGYIEEGEPRKVPAEFEHLPTGKLKDVARFREKPNQELAESFLNSGNYKWNAGMFVWTVPVILSEFQRQEPRLADFITQLSNSQDPESMIAEVFPNLPKTSVDYAVMERASRVLEVQAGFDWDDVGSWTALTKYLPADADSNHANTTVIAKDASHNLVFSEEKLPVALVGVSDLIVVQAKDAILICSRHDAEAIKAIIPELPESVR